MENIYRQRLEALRSVMREKLWDAVIITGGDPHGSEYPAPRWKQVEWLTGFTGEAGDVVVTLDHAGLWTDTRYFIQAVRQLEGTGVELHKTRVPEEVPIPQWLSSREWDDEEVTVAIDGRCHSLEAVEALQEAFTSPVRIVDVPDMLSTLWQDRPSIPVSPVITLGEDLTGASREKKINALRKFLLLQECDAILLTALDDIAWVLNVRGSDIAYNPFVISYLLVTMDSAAWFVRKDEYSRLDADTADAFQELEADGVSILGYDEVELALSGLSQAGDDISALFIDPSTLNYSLFCTLAANAGIARTVRGKSPVAEWKAVKNRVETELIRDVHIDDGLAMERFLYWLDRVVGVEDIREADAADRLDAIRADIPGYMGNSFATISAYGENAALPHYVTPSEGGARLQDHGLYLVDSGGQYLSGTTDITRTVPLGPCTALEKEDYTLVLKGHIDLAMALFPKGTPGCRIDALAREPLWRYRRNFGHGTGHGVGFFLGVHEGPQDIRQNLNPTPLKAGMVVSDEPGIYREGKHGVRHENLLLVVDEGTNDFGSWLGFETLTLCHFDTSVVLADWLTREERDWLNAYNERVYRELSPRLPSQIAAWLREKTRPV